MWSTLPLATKMSICKTLDGVAELVGPALGRDIAVESSTFRGQEALRAASLQGDFSIGDLCRGIARAGRPDVAKMLIPCLDFSSKVNAAATAAALASTPPSAFSCVTPEFAEKHDMNRPSMAQYPFVKPGELPPGPTVGWGRVPCCGTGLDKPQVAISAGPKATPFGQKPAGFATGFGLPPSKPTIGAHARFSELDEAEIVKWLSACSVLVHLVSHLAGASDAFVEALSRDNNQVKSVVKFLRDRDVSVVELFEKLDAAHCPRARDLFVRFVGPIAQPVFSLPY